MKKYPLPKGFYDYDHLYTQKVNYLKSILDNFCLEYGYSEVKLSPVEYSSIYENIQASTNKDFKFLDRKGRELILTADSSLGLLRYQTSLGSNFQTSKLNSMVQVFRYRRKKYRYFHQYSFEIFHKKNSLNYDKSLFTLSLDIINHFEIKYFVVFKDYKLIYLLLEEYLNEKEIRLLLYYTRFMIEGEKKENLLTMIDRNVFEIFEGLTKNKFSFSELKEYFSNTNNEKITERLNYLQSYLDLPYNFKFEFDFTNLNSSEFYDGISFSINNLENKCLIEGGRYDSLSQKISNSELYSAGACMAIEAFIDKGYVDTLPLKKKRIYVYINNGDYSSHTIRTLKKLRAKFPAFEMREDFDSSRSTKARIKAIKHGFDYFVVIQDSQLLESQDYIIEKLEDSHVYRDY